MLDIKLRVWVEKVMMILHIRGLKEDSVAKQVWRAQRAYLWPGLAQECENICTHLKIEDVNTTEIDKNEFRKYVTKACHEENERRLREEMRTKDKCSRVREERYGRKDYFYLKTPNQTREMYATRLSMLPWAGNYGHDRRFARTEWLCRCGESVEHEQHLVTSCPMYQDLRDKYDDMDDDSNLAAFFREALTRREAYDEEQKKEAENE